MHLPKCFFSLPLILSVTIARVNAQDRNVLLQPYNNWNIQKLYSGENAHTAFKPFLYVDTGYAKGAGSWIKRKLLDEHLLFLEKDGIHITADFIPDFQVGASSRRPSKTPWTNTRAARISGNIGAKVYFEAEDFENQARFPGYIDSYIRKTRVIPGSQRYRRNSKNSPYDFNHASARLIYMPVNSLRLDLGYGDNFIGDGYRSLLLSDWSFNYPYLRATFKYKTLQYSVMWSQYVSDFDEFPTVYSHFRKWGQTFFLDWQFSKNGNIGLFESVMWPDRDNNLKRDLSWTMASPIIFLHGNKTPSGTANATITGLNAKYKVIDQTYLYGQFAVSNFLRTSDWSDRFAAQLGVRSHNPFGIQGLGIIAEFNMARPYMYTGNSRSVNYAHYNQALAHPFGAYFKEGLIVATYQYKRWYARGEILLARYNVDSSANANGGNDIFKPLSTTSNSAATIETNLFLGDIRLAYIINPATNLRFEVGCTIRKEKAEGITLNDQVFMIGLRGSFRDIVYDF